MLKKVKQHLKKGRIENFNRHPELFRDTIKDVFIINGWTESEYPIYQIKVDGVVIYPN